MKSTSKKAASTTTAQTAKAPKVGTKIKNSNSELQNQVFHALDFFIKFEKTDKTILKAVGIVHNDKIIEPYAYISRNTAQFVKILLTKLWG